MSTKEDFQEFLPILVFFCNYFHDKLNSLSKSNIRGFKNASRYKELSKDYINLFGSEIDTNNFINFTLKLFERFNNFDFIAYEFHLHKDCQNVYKCISQLIKKNFAFEDERLNDNQKISLQLIHSTLAVEFIDDIETYVNKRVDATIDRTMNGKSILKNNYNEENHLACNDISFIPVGYLYEKIIKSESHINIMNYHINEKTTPKALFFGRFPAPYFKDDAEFIKAHNHIIEKTQNDIMNLIIDFHKIKINNLNEQLKIKKEELSSSGRYNHVNLEKVFTESRLLNEKRLYKWLESAKNKAEECEARPYTLEEFEHYFTKKKKNEEQFSQSSVSFDESSINSKSNTSGSVLSRSQSRNHNHNHYHYKHDSRYSKESSSRRREKEQRNQYYKNRFDHYSHRDSRDPHYDSFNNNSHNDFNQYYEEREQEYRQHHEDSTNNRYRQHRNSRRQNSVFRQRRRNSKRR